MSANTSPQLKWYMKSPTNHSCDVLVMYRFLHKQSSGCNAVLSFVKEDRAHALEKDGEKNKPQELLHFTRKSKGFHKLKFTKLVTRTQVWAAYGQWGY